MQNTLSIRIPSAHVPCYLEPAIVFKAKVARHVRIFYLSSSIIYAKGDNYYRAILSDHVISCLQRPV